MIDVLTSPYPQVTAEWREVEWSREKRTRFATMMLRLMADDDEDEKS
ncbi:hypothetical protein KME66_14775 [Streptomyces sp. YPW6]|nr:hypothetical protein [Streptomyces sp. YPW6]QWQ42133.1 hypothetical protein KME66_14775 [Streptomyces sp. YPW6]